MYLRNIIVRNIIVRNIIVHNIIKYQMEDVAKVKNLKTVTYQKAATQLNLIS